MVGDPDQADRDEPHVSLQRWEASQCLAESSTALQCLCPRRTPTRGRTKLFLSPGLGRDILTSSCPHHAIVSMPGELTGGFMASSEL